MESTTTETTNGAQERRIEADEVEVDAAPATAGADGMEDGSEELGAVVFKRCNHIASNTKKNQVKKNFKRLECHKCNNKGKTNLEEESLVLCLSCGKVHCGRYSINNEKHGESHFNGSKHCLALSIPNYVEFKSSFQSMEDKYEMLSIWCYRCDHWLHESNQDNDVQLKKLKDLIFGTISREFKAYVCVIYCFISFCCLYWISFSLPWFVLLLI